MIAHREIITVDELNDLPVGSVILAAFPAGSMERFEIGWAQAGNHVMHRPEIVPLPARLLWLPEWGR
ncbi:hypothetical protein [Mycolicibacterium peregrinum]|uniref:hypothetical protein n=1 Tax=Mycolicibacterium peregrinum TaxID=43304 RepID=UPI003AAD69D1